ncbi:hypothetical protein [Halobacillus sp. B23F22_1]|uniref:hypothetical protein n=1 Tax=Halobacillus sp. B23F22_1 TaxID=3459514 RepID=UPI00373F6EAA
MNKKSLQTYKVNKACAVTGEITDDNQEFAEGICLRPTGMQILYDELSKTQAAN